MLTLAIGDLYIPERSVDLPVKFRKLLSPNPNSIPSNNKIAEVVCLGNIINSNDTLKFLYNLSPSFNLVKGEFDDSHILSQQLHSISHKETPIPLYNVIVHDNLRIGFTNGYQIVPKNDPLALSNVAREIDVDILIWGGTHKVEAYTLDGKFFVNPGSATGAYTFDWPEHDEVPEEEEEEEEEEEVEEQHQQEKEGQEKEVNEEENKLPEGEVEDNNNEILANKEGKEDEEKVEDETVKETGKDSLFGNQEEPTINQTSDPLTNNIDVDILNEVIESDTIIPSFCLLDTQGSTCTLYIYTYLSGEVKVDKVTYTKE
ncbi:Metallo-dependent phosphatase-like protein [Scheffersomyces amazonensis]|uniref:Metallo-dependent phosphatase-like protein n=1 Tax=Scheffersomyces amazonensis TaxID=1078765 RepID=UPI00315D802F